MHFCEWCCWMCHEVHRCAADDGPQNSTLSPNVTHKSGSKCNSEHVSSSRSDAHAASGSSDVWLLMTGIKDLSCRD